MNATPARQRPAGYTIRVAARLDAHWSAWFDGLTVTSASDGTTSLTGFVADQSHLHGLLAKIRDLGIDLISVAGIEPSDTL